MEDALITAAVVLASLAGGGAIIWLTKHLIEKEEGDA